MKPAVLAFTSLLLLAGCIDSPTNARTDNLVIRIVTDEPFTASIPLPQDDLTTPQLWLDTFQAWLDTSHAAPSGVQLSLRPEAAGTFLHISGNGTVDLEARLARTPQCCGDVFIDGSWTDGQPRPVEQLTVHTTGKVVNLVIGYEATNCNGPACKENSPRNQICNLSFGATGNSLPEGWNLIQVIRDDHTCNTPQ